MTLFPDDQDIAVEYFGFPMHSQTASFFEQRPHPLPDFALSHPVPQSTGSRPPPPQYRSAPHSSTTERRRRAEEKSQPRRPALRTSESSGRKPCRAHSVEAA